MGPNEPTFQRKTGKLWERFYLSESAAARLWQHPLFTGTLDKRGQRPKRVELSDKTLAYDEKSKSMKVEGQVDCDLPVHRVIIHDDSSGPNQEYWRKTYVGRVDEAGLFSIEVDELSDHKGVLRFYLCVEGGMTIQCEAMLIYDFEKDRHVVRGFIPHSLPLAGGGVEKIVSAEWGTILRHFSGTTADVSDTIRKQVKNGAVSMWIDYKTLGDPEPGKRKYLKVRYLLEGDEQERRFESAAGNFLILPLLENATSLGSPVEE
jgi:hypothetical protein